MPPLPSTSMATRKRTRSTNISENNIEHQQTASTNSIPTTTATSVNISTLPPTAVATNAPPKRQRNNPPPTGPPPPVTPRTTYSFRNRSLTPDPRHPSTRFPSLQTSSLSSASPRSANRQRYNLRPRRPQSQVRLPQVPTPHPIIPPRRIRRPIPPIAQTLSSSSTNAIQPSSLPIQPPAAPPPPPPPAPVPPVIPPVTLPIPPVIQPRQYRLVYISDDDDEPTQATATIVNTTFNLVTDDEEDELIRPQRCSSSSIKIDIRCWS